MSDFHLKVCFYPNHVPLLLDFKVQQDKWTENLDVYNSLPQNHMAKGRTVRV